MALAALLVSALAVSASAADYTSPTLGTLLEAPSDLEIRNVQVLNQLPLPDGRVLIEASAAVSNRSDGLWSSVTVGFKDGNEVAIESLEFLPGTLDFGGVLESNAMLVATGGMYRLVNTADLTAARAELVGGSPLALYATDNNGQRISNPTNDLAIVNHRILGELAVSSNKTLLVFAADVQNLGSNRWTQLSIGLDAGLATHDFAGVGSAAMSPSQLAAFGTVADLPPFYAAVSSNDVSTAVSNVLSGAALTHSGFELWVFDAPPRGIDQETEDTWLPPATTLLGVTTLRFDRLTMFLSTVQPGDLLLEDPGVNLLDRPAPNPADPLHQTTPWVGQYVPFEVSGVAQVGNEVHVTGHVRTLLEVLKSATFFQDATLHAYDGPARDPYNPPLENTYTAAEQLARDAAAAVIEQSDPRDGRLAELRGFNATPWHFNEFPLTDKIRLSGELLLRSSGLKIQARIRNFALQHAFVHLDAGVEMNVVLECDGGENTTNAPPADKTADIFELNLPVVTLNIAGVPVTVGPVARLSAGVEANIPTRLVLPLQSSLTVGMEMGYDPSRPSANTNGFFYEPIKEFVPLRVSDPTVFDTLAAEAGAWLELELGIEGSIASVVQGGPTLAMRLGSDFRVAPLANPWWSFDASLDLIGRFSLRLLGIELVDANGVLDHNVLFHRDAGAGLGGIALASLTTDFKPKTAKTVRWARLLAPHFDPWAFGYVGTAGSGAGAVVMKAGGSNATDLIVAGTPGALARFNAQGDLLWAKDLGRVNGIAPSRGVALADGTFTLVGGWGRDRWLQHFDASGNRLWAVSFRTSDPLKELFVEDFLQGTNGSGQAEYYVVGYIRHGIVWENDPLVIKCDANGAVLWAKYYALPGDDQTWGATLTRDGHLALAGTTSADVAPPPYGTPDGENAGKNSTPNGLLMKISTADGALRWATAFVSGRGLTISSVAEGADGSLFAAGGIHLIVPDTFPAIFVGKFSADGTLRDHVTIGEDPDWPDELPTGGTSPYDLATRLRWTPEGLVACGSTGLGDNRSGWVLGLTDELGVKFYSVFDGGKGDWFSDIADAGDGLAVLGHATVNGARFGFSGFTNWLTPLLLKLPWEGILRFHEDSGLRSLFLQPRVFHSSASTLFQTLSGSGQLSFANSQSPVSCAVTDLALVPAALPPAPVANPNWQTVRLEATDPALIETYNDWAAYHYLSGALADPTANPDGDQLSNLFESYFGRNPYVPETRPVFTISAGQHNGQAAAILEFDRATHGPTLGVLLQSSASLTNWLTASNLVQEVQPLGGGLERVRLRDTPMLPQRFFRLVSP